MFKRILIANRGEIARRIQHTAERLGIETVAVFSDADASAGFVRHANRAVRIGPAAVTESYLRGDAIIQAALDQGAEAIHPGYGFVSENAPFARAVADAGLVFIGPAPDTIALMGSKTDAKRAMETAGVAGVPGYHGDAQDDATLAREADAIGFPVLIKASAGGGGKGMRVAPTKADFADACDAARREAANAFGDDQLLLEKFIERPRHVEVQVFGDHHGNVVHLFERECSVQRRYQKIIEEAPCPTIDDDLRTRMTDTAVRAAQAVHYRGAGTIEFIVTPNDDFYFMEMNTRLQVEHPVTEAITGIDLVEWQLRAAAGEPLGVAQDDIEPQGHAIECRVYAEDPFNNFVPSSGQVRSLDVPGAPVRVDMDLSAGQHITPFYDPMIAKLTVHEADRGEAIDAMREALDGTSIVGPSTNLGLLRLLMRHTDYLDARIDTSYLDRQLDTVLATHTGVPFEAIAAATVACALPALDNTSPWAPDGWQSTHFGGRRCAFGTVAGERCDATLHGHDGHWSVISGEHTAEVLSHATPGAQVMQVVLRIAGVQHDVLVVQLDDAWRVQTDQAAWELNRADLYPVVRADAADDRRPGAPMPGRIVKLLVTVGDEVEKGQGLLVMEGMKMELTISATRSGRVADLHCAQGDQVEAEVPLVEIEDL
ncbi:MAG: biotin carboxylase N-terminal domain-containing protein [Gammaproteobacteria bacterium]